MRRSRRLKLFIALLIASAALLVLRDQIVARLVGKSPAALSGKLTLIANPRTPAEKIVNGAKNEVNRGVRYDPSYIRISYPGGDVPPDQGACTDVIIRALRNAGCDLQKLIHEDMQRNWRLYPHRYGSSRPDSSIDHRRVPNHLAFMRRFAMELPASAKGASLATWKPGDLVYWRLWGTCDHCGVISNETGPGGRPLVIHNIGPTATQTDCLDSWQITGHFRFPSGSRR